MPSGVDAKVKAIEQRLERARSLLTYAPRAFVMEFAGTPKSGKSTSIEAIRHLFSRHGFRVHLLAERAAVCPIPMKGHLFFNTWCATSMLAELLANVEAETDIVLVDRGLFDALVWLLLQESRSELTANEARTIEAFLLLERWRRLFDLNVVMSVSAEQALAREDNQRITKKRGSIMDFDVLRSIGQSVKDAIRKHGPQFRSVVDHDTSSRDMRDSLIDLANRILNDLEEFLNPEILVVRREALEALPLQKGGRFGDNAVKTAAACIESNGLFVRREQAERNQGFVQIIPCGVLEHDDQVFVFRRKETDVKSRLYGRDTLWQGCHVQKTRDGVISAQLESALLERVTHSLFLSRVFPLRAVGYCWDKGNPKSEQHFGVVYQIQIDNPHTALDLRKKEFRKQRGHGLAGKFQQWGTLFAPDVRDVLEPWSQAILDGIRTAGERED
jgi:predicted NUDIX family phosphoesterase